jgi:CRISPR system Cascade subunit CasD
MSPDSAYLALVLDAPLQSWGFDSRFQRRTTDLHPTKSGVIGLICASMGVGKGTAQEREMLPQLTAVKMTSIALPRESNPVRRMEDFHTVLNTRRASGKMNDDPVVTRRQYLVDACFGIILDGDRVLLGRIGSGLQDPVWGVWLGRKSCIAARPLFVAMHDTRGDAWRAILRSLGRDEESPIESFTRVEDVDEFADGTDSYNDQPVSFGQPESSSEGRVYTVRRVRVEPGT